MSYFIADHWLTAVCKQLSVNAHMTITVLVLLGLINRFLAEQEWISETQTALIAGFFSGPVLLRANPDFLQTHTQKNGLIIRDGSWLFLKAQLLTCPNNLHHDNKITFWDSSLRQNEEAKASDIHVSFFLLKLRDSCPGIKKKDCVPYILFFSP